MSFEAGDIGTYAPFDHQHPGSIVTTDTRATCILALEHRLDALRLDLANRRFGWFHREDWRGAIHRTDMAREIRDVRAALRELRLRSWESVYPTLTDEPLIVYQAEGR